MTFLRFLAGICQLPKMDEVGNAYDDGIFLSIEHEMYKSWRWPSPFVGGFIWPSFKGSHQKYSKKCIRALQLRPSCALYFSLLCVDKHVQIRQVREKKIAVRGAQTE